MYEAQIRWPAMVVTRMNPMQNMIRTVTPTTAMMTPKTMARAATMAGRTARSLTVATTVSIVSRARADNASEKSFSATARDYPADPVFSAALALLAGMM